jgi:hypothetical protein
MVDDLVLDDKSVLSAVSLRDQSREAPRKRIDHARLDIDRTRTETAATSTKQTSDTD